MPLTNAEKQKRARDKRADKIARYEAALREIAEPIEGVRVGDPWAFYADLQAVARTALQPAPSRLHSKGEVND